MKNILKNENLLLFIPLTIIMIGSFFIMYQAKFVSSIYSYHLFKQILWFGLGYILMVIIQKSKIRFLLNYSFYFYLFSLFLLILVLFVGEEINGAKAWFNFYFFNFQPSEFAKVSILLYLTKVATDFKRTKTKEGLFLLKCLLIVLLPSFLVFLEPDTGAIVIYLGILLGVLLFSNIKKRWFILLGMLIIILLGSFGYLYFNKQDLLIDLIGTSFFYRMDRLINFKNGSGMQLNNALISLGNAYLWGHGIKKDILYVPEFPTDFAFTLGTSIWGFGGSLVILLCYLLLDIYFIKKLFNLKKSPYQSLINGFLIMFIFQQIQNIGMNLGLLPIMGIPLPFLSYGGTNTLINYLFLGIILNLLKEKNI